VVTKLAKAPDGRILGTNALGGSHRDMVKIVFHANKPMWVGLVLGLVGALLLLLHLTVLSGREWAFTAGIVAAIAGMIIYLAGRAKQLMQKRF
jgi:hypothetical protein